MNTSTTHLQNVPSPTPAAGRETPTLLVPVSSPGGQPLQGSEPASPYQIFSEIGHGGMSIVYLAKDLKLGRFVAIKRLSRAFLADTAMRERFAREAQLIASLNHIHIVKLYDFDTQRADPQIVMEYVAGPGKPPAPDWPPPSLNLEQKLEQNGGPLTLRASVILVKKLCTAIDYAHRHGVIHRDLKPSNILLDDHGEPRIVDFGIARQTTSDAAKLTMTGTRMLSLGYAAPEQELDPGMADERSDVYSLGGILYFCLTGENPRFFRDSRVPDYLRPMLLKALEQEPGQRWPSARDFADVLAQSAGDFLSPLTDPGMWRCKWCNALNPVANRYCSHCNWDGMERCPECDGETRVGVRFCGQCSSDIKTFEDMRALLSRLREYRRQKDFARIKDAMDGTDRFHPRGGKGQELKREILELGETANWAIQRKDELTQAIAVELDRQNFEGVRERLNEYGVLDDGPEYQGLRSEIPWRIAERNILALRTELNRARQALADRQPGEAHKMLADIEDRLLSVSRLESQFPSLKGALTLPEAAQPGAEPTEYAKAVAALSRDAEKLKAEVEDALKTVEHLLQQAAQALKAQDYEGCLRAGEALRDLSLEPSPADAMMKKAAAQMEQIDKLLARANEALQKGHLRVAERMVRDVLHRLKEDSIAARHLLDRVHMRRRRRTAMTLALGLVCALLFYGLSIGPAFFLLSTRGATTAVSVDTLRAFYRPVYWLHANTPLKNGLERYASRWDKTIF
jgi:serine/threonine protein kinase